MDLTNAPAAVDAYLEGRLATSDEALRSALATSQEAGLPDISVSANQGKLLHVLARSVQARRVLEIGTLGGFSTIWLARALLEGGRLITLERDPKHAEVAQQNVERAGVAELVDLRLGPAAETLAALHDAGEAPFDFVFIDADKPSIPDYYEGAMKLTRPGGLIVVDNVVRRGELANLESEDADAIGCQRLVEKLAADDRVSATVVQTVGSKGHDGMALITVLG